MRLGSKSWLRDVPALRFLMMLLLTWVGLRALTPDIYAQRPDSIADARLDARPDWASLETWPPRRVETGAAGSEAGSTVAQKAKLLPSQPALPARGAQLIVGAVRSLPITDPPETALMTEREQSFGAGLKQRFAAAADIPASAGVSHRRPDAAPKPSPPSPPSARAGWSLSAWALIRQHGGGQGAFPLAGELAGSQAGARLAYGLGATGRLRAYGRATTALQRTQQSEVAAGLSYAPISSLPLDIAVEWREKLGDEGRSAMAAMVVGGVSGKPLPLKLRLDAYAQAGMVGLRSRDLFADGALVIDRSVNRNKEASALRLGAVIAGAAQPDLSRLDIGPRVTLPLPSLGKGARIAVDWRERVAGHARPDGGVALTLGADF